MIVFPRMLLGAAEKAGMKTPPDADNFNAQEFPHFAVYCAMQLCRPIRWGEHWENAVVIAAIPDDKIMLVTHDDLAQLGCAL
jgi:hypothetical protein